MRRLVLLALVAAAIALAVACNVLSDFGGPFHGQVPVDGMKHFVKDLEYHQWNGTQKFNRDGTFEVVSFNAPTETANPQTDGLRGTYTYDPATLTCRWKTRQEFNTRVPGAWYDLAPTESHTVVANLWFGDDVFMHAFLRDGAGWTQHWIDENGDANAVPQVRTWDGATTYTISAGAGGFERRETGTFSVAPYLRAESIIKGDAELFPAGVVIAKGNYFNVHVDLSVNTDRTWNWDTDSWNDLQYLPLGYRDFAFLCMGGYILELDPYASRGIR
jgi:hypothetical protein